ncbi:flagellin [Xinfangfangia sp. CPCC 101601]|uniref:Flagellin n=1 Tax=Pseudogemmobacter lacusdianii TaxID=3069608 RepID=A0ABU0VU99_9RHOB|nr:flagellin [Xinfangfangia sp. CPCC 101601]MDQ2065307.1 flagellin [Xinfangfangia sp. CPCC 101601]
MSSILTNTSAMVALQTLKGVNASMGKVQAEISTGKTVGSAKDNAAVWAISKVMESDVKGFRGISDSLSLGSSTIAVAREAAESVTNLLTEMKKKVVAAQEGNVDRAKIQADISKYVDQINSVVSAAQFNGLNLVNGSQTTVAILASLDRSGTAVNASSIGIEAQNLSTGEYVANEVFTDTTDGVISEAGDTFVLSLSTAGGEDTITIEDGPEDWVAGDRISVRIGNREASYTVTQFDIDADNAALVSTVPDLIAVGLKNAIDALGIAGLTVNYDSTDAGQLAFINDGDTDLTVTGQYKNAGSGGLAALSSVDVSTAPGATTALAQIESLLRLSIDAAAEFGSAQKRIEIQSDFVNKLSDAMTSGIGTLVDADMEEASARLQALQVQQQLGIQALSIANQQPQNLLALFR